MKNNDVTQTSYSQLLQNTPKKKYETYPSKVCFVKMYTLKADGMY